MRDVRLGNRPYLANGSYDQKHIMNWMEFIVKLVEALAWPVLTAIAFFSLKKNLLSLFPFLKRLKLTDIELEFEQRTAEAAELVGKTLSRSPVSPVAETLDDPIKDRIMTLIEVAPQAAVLESWKQVERAAKNLMRTRGLVTEAKRLIGPLELKKCLTKIKGLNDDQIEAFSRLRSARNAVVHSADFVIPQAQAVEYVETALELAKQLAAANEA